MGIVTDEAQHHKSVTVHKQEVEVSSPYIIGREEAELDEPRFGQQLGQQQAEGGAEVQEGRRGAPVLPKGPEHPAAGAQQHSRRVGGARA